MKFEIDDNVLRFLTDQGQSDLTLDLEEIPLNCCLGRLPEMRISHRSPGNPSQYRHFNSHGISIHVSRALRTGETLTLFLSGFGKFRKLEVAGVNLVL